VSTLTKRLVFPALGIALLGALVWQGRRLASAPAQAARNADSARVVPQGSDRTGARIQAEGRVVTYPGAEVTVGTEVVGRIVRLTVQEKDAVQPGSLIAELDDTELRASYAEVEARIRESEADLALFESDLTRLTPLAANSVVSRQSLDRTRRDRDAAIARRELARATIKRLDAAIAKTRIVAPIGGQVITRHANAGEIIAPGAPIVTRSRDHVVRVEAEVDEFDAHRLALKDHVTITAEGSGETLTGRIEEIPDAVVRRRLNPQDPGRPTDVRVLIAKIALDKPTKLKLGQRVEVVIETTASVSGDTAARRSIP